MPVYPRHGGWNVRWKENGRGRGRAFKEKADAVAFDAEIVARQKEERIAARGAYQTPEGRPCIPLQDGTQTLIDAYNMVEFREFYWQNKRGYVARSRPRSSSVIWMHREVMGEVSVCERCGEDEGYIHVHHRNDDPLDNRRSNLEALCSPCHYRHHRTTGPPLNPKRTHCPNGHEYTPANTYLQEGYQACKTCRKQQELAQNERRKAQRRALRAAKGAA